MDERALGLKSKFKVERLDGSSAPGGKHHDCFVFVLDLKHDKYAVRAIEAYTTACEAEYPLLAMDLRAWCRFGTEPAHTELRYQQCKRCGDACPGPCYDLCMCSHCWRGWTTFSWSWRVAHRAAHILQCIVLLEMNLI